MTQPVHAVDYDRTLVKTGIVHFGVGNFHRSHQAMYLDRLLSDSASFDVAAEWGICGVGVLPNDIAMRGALLSQDCEYTLIERHPDGTALARRIGSIVDYLYAPEELDTVLNRLAHPNTRIVSLTITEGGYNISDVTGEFDAANPAVFADAQPGQAPTTVFGIIVAGLRMRRARGVPPFTIMSCDNIEANGEVARRSFVSFATLIDPELAKWIAESVSFPNSMVDRITPVTTDADRHWVREEYGIEDAWPVLSEDFVQWVLEDDFALGRPPLERAGVQLVDDVRPYELMKLRLLNGSHQALAYAGILSGYEFAHEAASDPVIRGMLGAYMDTEASWTLEPVPGIDLDTYKESLLARFGNPYVRDTLARLATDASDRIPKFLLPVIRDRRLHGKSAAIAASVIAAWARYAELYVLGEPVPFRDRHEQAVRDAVARQAGNPAGFLESADWFGALAADKEFTRDFSRAISAFRQVSDPRQAIAGITTRALQPQSAR